MIKTATIIHTGEIAGSGRTGEVRGKSSFRKSAIYHKNAAYNPCDNDIFSSGHVGSGRAPQGESDKIAVAGSPIPGVRAETKKSNQSQVVWYQGYWWGVFRPTDSGSNWLVYKYDGNSWTPNGDTGINSGDFFRKLILPFIKQLYLLLNRL